MADTPKPGAPAEDDMHWGIAYLREDIQDLRLGLRASHDRMDTIAKELTARMDAMNNNLTARMDAMNGSLTARMDAMGKDLSSRMDSRFAVLLTAMIALNGVTIGVVLTALQNLPAQ